MSKKRLVYLLFFLVLLSIVVCIGVFVRGGFVRDYLGDVLVVGVVYCFVRIFVPKGCRLLPLYVFAFAVVVELLQLTELDRWVGEKSRLLGIIVGGVFDWKDIVCYAVGCAIIAGAEFAVLRYSEQHKSSV